MAQAVRGKMTNRRPSFGQSAALTSPLGGEPEKRAENRRGEKTDEPKDKFNARCVFAHWLDCGQRVSAATGTSRSHAAAVIRRQHSCSFSPKLLETRPQSVAPERPHCTGRDCGDELVFAAPALLVRRAQFGVATKPKGPLWAATSRQEMRLASRIGLASGRQSLARPRTQTHAQTDAHFGLCKSSPKETHTHRQTDGREIGAFAFGARFLGLFSAPSLSLWAALSSSFNIQQLASREQHYGELGSELGGELGDP